MTMMVKSEQQDNECGLGDEEEVEVKVTASLYFFC